MAAEKLTVKRENTHFEDITFCVPFKIVKFKSGCKVSGCSSWLLAESKTTNGFLLFS
jgi:hypothetical protein